jgi:hypothetical protein
MAHAALGFFEDGVDLLGEEAFVDCLLLGELWAR